MVRKILANQFLGLFLLLSAFNAQASLTTDLENLVGQLNQINNDLATFSFDQGNGCSQLGTLNISIEDFIQDVQALTAQMTTPVSLTTEDLNSLDELSLAALNMAGESLRLSWELRLIEDSAELFEYRAALTAMLRLSDDIGAMADRILEMADRILIMADNINLMADRIIQTQILQYNNMAVTQASLLTTQENMVFLSDSISSIVYDMSAEQLGVDLQTLSDEMALVSLTSDNMAAQLDQIAIQTQLIFDKTNELFTWMITNSMTLSHYINGTTLTTLGDLSNINAELASSLEMYANTVNQLSANTDSAILGDSVQSMLRLTADIGTMANRIMEMSSKIIIMADNIGTMADQIIVTEQLMLTNTILTQSSLTTAQNVTITVIKNSSL